MDDVPEGTRRHISMIFQTLIEGYKAKDWLSTHECDECEAGAKAFEAGLLNKDNMYENMCKEALEAITKVAKSDMIVSMFDSAMGTIWELKQEQYGGKYSEELGLRTI